MSSTSVHAAWYLTLALEVATKHRCLVDSEMVQRICRMSSSALE